MSVIWPYTYSWVNDGYKMSVNSLTNAFNIGGISNAIFAFVIADSSGNVASDLDYKLQDLINFQSLGGNLRISFGGALGTMIDESITDETRLYNEYINIITKTNCTSFDFDIEGSNVWKTAMHEKRNRVLSQLQRDYPMFISYTLSADTNGLSNENRQLLRNAVEYGINIDMVNVMLMDNGWTDSAISSIQSIQTLQNQLRDIWPNKSISEINRMIGACFMIGQNDDSSFFSLENANTVVDYLNSIGGIGQISYWALQRDTTGEGDYSIRSLYNNNDFDFYNIFSRMINSQSSELPVESPIDSPIELPVESPIELPTALPIETRIETPVESPIELPTEAPTETSFTYYEKERDRGDRGVLDVGVNLIINGVKYSVEQTQNMNWLNINGVTLGESLKYNYKTVVSGNLNELLYDLYKDKTVKLLNYNWKERKAYVKTGYDLFEVGDVSLNNDYTVFIKK